jgi:CubicO group peptidase (beta-lactamase class C family)
LGIEKIDGFCREPFMALVLGLLSEQKPVSLHGQGTIGDYWWGGWAGTYFWIDPKEEISVVYMMQDTSNRVHLLRFK